MQTMYSAQINSSATELKNTVTAIQTEIEVEDASILPDAPNLLTLGFIFDEPETIRLLSKTGNILQVQRGFEGLAKTWEATTKIARVFTAYDHNAFKYNLENLPQEDQFTTTNKFIDSQYLYFVGDILNGWRVNRYNVGNSKTTSSGVLNKPTSLIECQGLIYE